MRGDPEPDDRLTARGDLVARVTGGLRRAWASEKGRRRIVISAVVVVAVISIAVVASLFASLAGESQAYKDGYSAGGAAYTAYGASSITAKQACRDEATGPGGRPAHDNPGQWVQGCADAFELAQSDN
jgi:threonine/homoserine/homoserine lactone efflux protein